MWNIKKRVLPLVATGVLVAVGILYIQKIARADAPSIVINELMYNPASNVDNDEFLELYNTTGSSIDLGGWCFTRGITLCFSPGTTISSHDHGVISPSASQTSATYGVATIGTYIGKLDNGGERLTLVDASSQVVSDFTYDDVSPWPTTPDGGGPSLELKDPNLDYTQAPSWGASIGGATPGAINSLNEAALPELTDITHPENVNSETAPVISVKAANASDVELNYKISFENEQTIAMHDDGLGGDAATNDGYYSARIPAQTAGQLVRYKVSASNATHNATLPGDDDTVNYYGYTIEDPTIETQLPIFQWFIDDNDLADMIANHSQDNQEFNCVVAYGNTVIDNAKVHIKGQTTRNMHKKAFAVDLPQGHKLQMAGMTRAVDEFHLNSTYLDPSGTVDVLAWRLAEQIGMPTTQVFKIRLQQNGNFYGLYTFAEEYDKQWRQEFGYQDGSFYKGGEKKTREDFDDGYERELWNQAVSSDTRSERVSYAINHQDVPNTINLMAFGTFIRNSDMTFGKNWLSYHDITNTGRWQSLPYDFDGAFDIRSVLATGNYNMTPYEMGWQPGVMRRTWRGPLLALYDDPVYRQLYFRRLRTIVDDYLLSGWLEQQYDEIKNQTAQESAMDYQKWGSLSDPSFTRQYIPYVFEDMKYNYTNRFRTSWGVPIAQSANPVVSIQTVGTGVGDHNGDYIMLKNNTSEVVDMSLWQIPEVDFTLPPGSVIAPGQEAVIPRNDPVYTQTHPNSYIIGQLKVDISSLNSISLKRKNGTTSDTKVIFE